MVLKKKESLEEICSKGSSKGKYLLYGGIFLLIGGAYLAYRVIKEIKELEKGYIIGP